MNFELYIPANITSYLDGFNRKRYAALCDEYMKLCQPFFDELEQCADIPAAARELAQWMDGRVSGFFKKRKFCDMQYFLLTFAAPAALERHSEKADAFAEAVRSEWMARHPDMPYECTDFERLRNGFSNKIFGFSIGSGDGK